MDEELLWFWMVDSVYLDKTKKKGGHKLGVTHYSLNEVLQIYNLSDSRRTIRM